MKKTLALATVALLAGISLAAAQQSDTNKSKTTDSGPGAASSAGGPAQQNKGTGMSGTTGAAPMAPASTAAPKSSTDNPKNLNAQDKSAKPTDGK